MPVRRVVQEILDRSEQLGNPHMADGHIWDILCALRGPDFCGRHVDMKWLTTARIRSIIGIEKTFGVSVNPEKFSKAEIGNFKDLAFVKDDHFYRHVIQAIEALKQLGYDVFEPESTKDK